LTDLRVVFDINVWVDAVSGPDSKYPYLTQVPPRTQNPAADCFSLALDGERFQVFTSPHVLDNVSRVFGLLGVTNHSRGRILEAIVETVSFSLGSVVDPPRSAAESKDFEDNLILDLAIATNSQIIITSDVDFQKLSPVRGIAILSPRDFLSWLLPR